MLCIFIAIAGIFLPLSVSAFIALSSLCPVPFVLILRSSKIGSAPFINIFLSCFLGLGVYMIYSISNPAFEQSQAGGVTIFKATNSFAPYHPAGYMFAGIIMFFATVVFYGIFYSSNKNR